jgi:diguanylate cyclase (GGDEF)-like protein
MVRPVLDWHRIDTTPEQQRRIARGMSRELGRRMVMSASTSFLGYGLQALLLGAIVPTGTLVAWLLLTAGCELFNGWTAHELRRQVDDPALRRRLTRRLMAGLLCTGSSWGAVVLLPGVADDLPVLMTQALCVAVVGILSIHNLCFHPGCLAAFGIGLSLSTCWAALMLPGVPWPLAAAGMMLVGVTQIYGRHTRILMHNLLGATIVNHQINIELTRSHRELEQAMAELRQLASVDPLTQCLNRRALLDALHRERARCERHGGSFGLIMLDLDHFKAINDAHGHAGGDQVLLRAARCLREHLRPTDHVGRWGGEEFLCLLSPADATGLRLKAEALRRQLQDTPVPMPGETLRITASLGVACHQPGLSLEALIEQADSALYRAKRAGRNRVCG